MKKPITASRNIDGTAIRIKWDGQIYTVTVKPKDKPSEVLLYGPLPKHFGFEPTSDYAFDITARSALRGYGSQGGFAAPRRGSWAASVYTGMPQSSYRPGSQSQIRSFAVAVPGPNPMASS